MDELIDIYDENDNSIGIQKLKSEAHRIGLWHRTAHIWIYNSKGDILLQLRAKNKDLHPGMWDISAAGHVSAGEEVINSAIREVKEEIGLDVSKNDLELFKIMKYSGFFKKMKINEFYYVFLLKYDGSIENLKLQKEEVEKVRFIFTGKIEKDLLNPKTRSKYVSHGEYWFDIIRKVRGILK